jgi:hypothetical protein
VSSSTTEFWDVDGVSLNQYAWNITTLGGSRGGLPPLRGDNVQYAYRPGKDFRTKVPDSRVLTLAMWVAGVSPTTDLPAANQRVQWNDNWRALRRLLWTPGRQVDLTRRAQYSTGLEVHTAKAQLAGTMDPSMTGRTRAEFTIDFLLADPYFYGVSSTTSVPVSTPTTVTNAGDDVAGYSNFQLVFHGPLTAPKVTNSTYSPSVWVKAGSGIASGDTLTLDVESYTASRASDSANLIGTVSHSGARQWMLLAPGANTLTLTADGGSGSVDVVFRPPYV